LPPERTVAPLLPSASQTPANGLLRRLLGRRDAINGAQLGYLAERIDWDADPEALRRGDLCQLPSDIRQKIRSAAEIPTVATCAVALGLDPVVFVVALLARFCERSNWSAKRLAHSVLGTKSVASISQAMRYLGL